MPPRARNSDPIAAAIAGLGFVRTITDIGWEFDPSIGLVAKKVDKLGLDIQSFVEPLTKAIEMVLIPSFKENFAVGGRPDAWDDLSPDTVKLRGAEGPILVRSGALEAAATSLGIWDIGATSATIRGLPGNAWYGAIHQGGYGGAGKSSIKQQTSSSAAKTYIPQRQFILFQDEDIPKIQEIFYDWLGEQVEAFGGL